MNLAAPAPPPERFAIDPGGLPDAVGGGSHVDLSTETDGRLFPTIDDGMQVEAHDDPATAARFGVSPGSLFDLATGAHYAVVDVETTGLDAGVHRVIECAVVELDPSGGVVDEWVSLVAIPGVEEPGAGFVHGITRSMLEGAPSFAEIIPELIARLSGRVVVGHVLDFDAGHLAAEFQRARIALPDLVAAGLCTRDLARLHLPAGRRSLEICCAMTGVVILDEHTALGDARAAAGLLRWFIEAGHSTGWQDRIDAAPYLAWPAPGWSTSSGDRPLSACVVRPGQFVTERVAPA